MRRPEPLDPAVERDLETLDAALAGDTGADAELAALVAEVRAVAPRRDPGARAALDARVAAGFPGAHGAPRRLRLLPSPRLMRRALLPAAGAVAAALVALLVVTGPLRGGGGSASDKATAVQERSGQADDQAGGGGSSAGAGAATPSLAPAPGIAAPPSTPGRRVERTVRLELGARADRFDAVTDDVVRTTQRAGGFVAESELLRNGGRGRATYVLRIRPRASTRPSPRSAGSRTSARSSRAAPTSPARRTRPPRACATPAPAAARSSRPWRPRRGRGRRGCASASPRPGRRSAAWTAR